MGLSRSSQQDRHHHSKLREELVALLARMADTQQSRENGVHGDSKRKLSIAAGGDDASTPALLKKMKMESDAPPEVRFWICWFVCVYFVYITVWIWLCCMDIERMFLYAVCV